MRILYFAIFIIIALTVYIGIHYYIFNRVVLIFTPSHTVKNYLALFFVFAALTFPFGEILGRKFPSINIIIYIGALWLGIISLAITVLFLHQILTLIFNNSSFKYYSGIFSLVLISITFLYSFYNVYRNPIIKEITIINKKLPDKFNDFTIVQLSDIHLGSMTTLKWFKSAVDKTNKLNPDIIVITGDLIDGEIARANEFNELIKLLKAKYGVFAITGNHEYYAGVKKFVDICRETNITYLNNENKLIEDTIYLAGVEDNENKQFGGTGSDLELALKNCDKSKPIILLNHRPTNFKKAVGLGVDLQLSGHTHAGQIPPMDFLVWLYYKYPFGLHSYKGSYIYTSVGTGTWRPPLRLFSKSEITKIILRVGRV